MVFAFCVYYCVITAATIADFNLARLVSIASNESNQDFNTPPTYNSIFNTYATDETSSASSTVVLFMVECNV